MKFKSSIVLIFLFLFISGLTVFTIEENAIKNKAKEDLIELSNIKYELANIDVWKKIIQDLLIKKINDFELSGTQKNKMRPKLIKLFTKILNDYEKNYKQEQGFFKVFGASVLDVFGTLKKEVPNMVDSTIKELDSNKNKDYLKHILISKIDEIVDSTFAKIDYTIYDSILSKYNSVDGIVTKSILTSKVEKNESKLYIYKALIIIFSIVLAVFILVVKVLSKLELIGLVYIASLLLFMGVVLPMIEIDARISEINFSMLGETVSFSNQVLYYKSKSILEVVRLMLTQGGFDLLIVGLFILLFSVVFPISKLVSITLQVIKPGLSSNKVINFLVNKTGKWSMADVMVVSIFMAYIGFSGILTEQLGQIESMTAKIDILTTNKSSLQTGFVSFFCFAVLGILISSKLKSTSKKKLS
jgi:hypothetical protein